MSMKEEPTNHAMIRMINNDKNGGPSAPRRPPPPPPRVQLALRGKRLHAREMGDGGGLGGKGKRGGRPWRLRSFA